MNLNPALIVYDIRSAIGDTVVNIPALCLIRKMYPDAYLVVATNNLGSQFYPPFGFYDQLINYQENTPDDFKTKINQAFQEHDTRDSIWILCNRTSYHIKYALSFPIENVITFSHLKSFYLKRLSCPLWFKRNGEHEIFHYLRLIKKTNPKRFKEALKSFELEQVRLKGTEHNAAVIEQFLQEHNSQNYRKIVAINPFAKSQTLDHTNFTLDFYVDLAHRLAEKFPEVLFLLMTYDGNTQNDALNSLIQADKNLAVWSGDKDLYNLVEFIKRTDLLISPSTGTIHIADNMGCCGHEACTFSIYTKLHRYRWSGDGLKQLKTKVLKSNHSASNQTFVPRKFIGITVTPETLDDTGKKLPEQLFAEIADMLQQQ